MKKNTAKKLLSAVLCVALVFAMAMPAFAGDGGHAPTIQDYGLANTYRGNYARLNVYISNPDNIKNGTNITVYKADRVGNPTMLFRHELLSSGYYMVYPITSCKLEHKYVLNINTVTKNCNLWRVNELPPEDYSIRFADEGGDYRGIILIHRLLGLTVSDEQMSAGGYNVNWQPSYVGYPSRPDKNPQIWDHFLEWD